MPFHMNLKRVSRLLSTSVRSLHNHNCPSSTVSLRYADRRGFHSQSLYSPTCSKPQLQNTCQQSHQKLQQHNHASKRSFVAVPESKEVFDRNVKQAQKTFAANLSNSPDYDYLRLEIANRIVSRLLDLDREMPTALDLGANSGQIYKELINHIKSFPTDKRPGGITTLYQKDSNKDMLFRDEINFKDNQIINTKDHRIAGPEEDLSDFENEKFDLVVSSMSLQWNNDLRSCFKEVLRVLRPDGAFVGAFVGGNTLQELRSALVCADTERRGGLGTHVSPMVKVRDIGDLLAQCGFALVTTDSESIEIPYPNMFVLCEHLRGAGDNNASLNRDKFVSQDVFLAAAAAYDGMYNNEDTYKEYMQSIGRDGQDEKLTAAQMEAGELPDSLRMSRDLRESINEDTTVVATFEIIFFIAWSPHESQQKPLERGSAQSSFQELGQETETVEELIRRKEEEKKRLQEEKEKESDEKDGKE